MVAGIVPWLDKFHVCVFFDGCYRHSTFLRTGDARSIIADSLREHGVREAVLATSHDVDPIADSLKHRGLDLYGVPLRLCMDIAAAACLRTRPRTFALVAVRAFFLPAWQPHLVPWSDAHHATQHHAALDPLDMPF